MSLSWKRDLSVSRTTANFFVDGTFDVVEGEIVSPGDVITVPLGIDYGDGRQRSEGIAFTVRELKTRSFDYSSLNRLIPCLTMQASF